MAIMFAMKNLLICVLLSYGCVPILANQDFSKALEIVEPSTVLIRAFEGNNKTSIGTGFFINDTDN